MPLMRLKTTSSVKPTIRKGNKINHTNGKSMSVSNARGQQITKRRNHKTRLIKVLMLFYFCDYESNNEPFMMNLFLLDIT